jgi:hypothetical protein
MEKRVLITCHTPLFRGSIINGNGNGNTSPPQIAGHVYDIRYRTKHPIDLQATSLQSSTDPAPSQFISQNAFSLSLCPSLRLNITQNSLFSDGGAGWDEKHEMAPIILCPNSIMQSPFAAALRDLGEIVSSRKKKTRGRDTSVTVQKGISQGGFTRPSAQRHLGILRRALTCLGLSTYRSSATTERPSERTVRRNLKTFLVERFISGFV